MGRYLTPRSTRPIGSSSLWTQDFTGTNPGLSLLGLVLTLSERTVIARETYDALVSQFGELVFQTQIRRSIALRESPAVGQSVFAYAPKSAGAEDYSQLAIELITRLGLIDVHSAEGAAHV